MSVSLQITFWPYLSFDTRALKLMIFRGEWEDFFHFFFFIFRGCEFCKKKLEMLNLDLRTKKKCFCK